MQDTRPRSRRIHAWLAAVAVLSMPGAMAMGIGGGGSSVVLGQPLDFAVQLRLEPGEILEPRCVSAEVTVGDRQLPAGAVSTQYEMLSRDAARVRVQTQTGMDEPVIGVQITAGCQARVSRRFVLLADPPELAPAPVAAALPEVATVLRGNEGGTAPPVTTPPPAAMAVMAAPTAPLPAAVAPQRVAQASPPAAAPARPRAAAAAPAASAASAARPTAPARATSARQAERPRRAEARPPAAAAARPTPRLRLESPEPPPTAEAAIVEQAIEAVAQAASAARAAAAAASASAQRIAALERNVQQLQGEARNANAANAALRAQLQQAEGGGRWLQPLLVAVVVLAGLAAWLAWRVSELQKLRQRSWRDAAGAVVRADEPSPSKQPTAPIPFVTSEITLPAPVAPPAQRPRVAPAWPPPAPPDTRQREPDHTQPPPLEPRPVPAVAARAAMTPVPAPVTPPRPPVPDPDFAYQRTEPLPPSLRVDDGAPRDVSIEELIDLEQQAEFFIVLGQDESAIDLLVDHLRNTGGGSPLPYLKLLEIYRRRGEREAYERTRTRFNHRFNAYAPDWDSDLAHGRSLEDYAGVLPRLEQVWPRPLDAMAELEALLFRKSRGELFDLPAYREVLFLYSLARDRLDRESVDTGSVDLLLPLSDGSEFSSTTPGAFTAGSADSDFGGLDDRPTAPIDLDLSQPERRSSIFGTLDDLPSLPPRR